MWPILLLIVLLLPLALATGALLLNRVPLFAPPGIGERLTTYLGQNTAELRPDAAFPELRPAVYPIKPDRLCRQIPPALEELGWDWQGDASSCRYRATVATPLLGFRDDVRVTAERVGDASSRLVIHSASRLGRGDFGANARHILDLVAAVEKQE